MKKNELKDFAELLELDFGIMGGDRSRGRDRDRDRDRDCASVNGEIDLDSDPFQFA